MKSTIIIKDAEVSSTLEYSEKRLQESVPDDGTRETIVGLAMIEIESHPDEELYKRCNRAIRALYIDCGVRGHITVQAVSLARARLRLW